MCGGCPNAIFGKFLVGQDECRFEICAKRLRSFEDITRCGTSLGSKICCIHCEAGEIGLIGNPSHVEPILNRILARILANRRIGKQRAGKAKKNGPYHVYSSPFRLRYSLRIWRMASERDGGGSCEAAQVSIPPFRSSDRRMAVTGSTPVAGRPLLFDATFFIICVLRILTLE